MGRSCSDIELLDGSAFLISGLVTLVAGCLELVVGGGDSGVWNFVLNGEVETSREEIKASISEDGGGGCGLEVDFEFVCDCDCDWG